MANQVAARLQGDEYQHLYSWYYALELLMMRRNAKLVTVEDSSAGSFDDVTIRRKTGAALPDEFHQIKYHVDQRGEYSSDRLIERDGAKSSLLEKFFRTWASLREKRPNEDPVLRLVSNWGWSEEDVFRRVIDGHDGGIKAEFSTAPTASRLGQVRDGWQAHLQCEDVPFRGFLQCLQFRFGFDTALELTQRVSERMENQFLKADAAALKTSAGIIRERIMRGPHEIDLDGLKDDLERHGLHSDLPHRSATVYLSTIKRQRFEIAPDYEVDWCEHFEGTASLKGHAIKSTSLWNGALLPELQSLEARLNAETQARLIRFRGFARLSAWFAAGNVFSEVAGYSLEVSQNDNMWRTDASPSDDFTMSLENGMQGEELVGDPNSVAIGISITGEVGPAVRHYLEETRYASRLFLMRPNRPLGRDCFRDASDVVAFARHTKDVMRAAIQGLHPKCILLFYFGPLSGACFLGHQLNAMRSAIQIMEDQNPGYAPAFTL